jgi:Spy/CpxP family protein refolding chaperone
MHKVMLAGALLAFGLILSAPAYSAETERSKPSVPEELVDAWERLQRALQDWGGQLRERFGTRDAREERPTISLILKNKDHLRLSADQVKKLEQQRDQYQRQSIRSDAELRILELDLADLLDKPNVDVSKVEQKIREIEKLRADLRIARVRAVEQAKAVLTAEQRKKFYETFEPRSPRSGQNPSSTERESLSR